MVSLTDVLLAMSNIPVDDPIAEMWGRGLQGGYKIIEYTGTLPIEITADGTALIDYCIYGNTVQAGTPTPENPVDVVGCGERTENIYNKTDSLMNFFGYVNNTSRAVATSSSGSLSVIVPVEPSTTYTIVKPKTSRFRVGLFTSYPYVNETATAIYGDRDGDGMDYGTSLTFTTSNDTSYILAFIRNYNDSEVTVNQMKNSTMVFKGSTAPESYIPYGYKLPIVSNSTVTNIYLGKAETTRRVKKLVLTGEELWKIYQNTYYITVSGYYRLHDVGHHLSVCSHFPINQKLALPEMCYGLGGLIDEQAYTAWNGNIVFNPSPMISSLAHRESYLAAQYVAGTPVTVWYVLAEPETGIVNEPLMKIGDYVDTLSMEQAGVSIPTNKGETIIDYNGELKPSQMYIKYRR